MSRCKRNVKERHIHDEDDQYCLKTKTEVGVVVNHPLLRKRQVSRLRAQQSSPLKYDNAAEVRCLRMLKSFCSVADLSIGECGVAVEVRSLICVPVNPSALRPRVCCSLSVEQSKIYTSVISSDPRYRRLETFIAAVAVSIARQVRIVNICCFRECAFLGV